MCQGGVCSPVLSVPRQPFTKQPSGHSVPWKMPSRVQTANFASQECIWEQIDGRGYTMALWEWEGADKLQTSITEKCNYCWAAACWSHCFTSPSAFWTGGIVKWCLVTRKCCYTSPTSALAPQELYTSSSSGDRSPTMLFSSSVAFTWILF